MYPVTQDALIAQAAYRRERLAADFHRASTGEPRRWRRSRVTGRRRLS